MSSFELSFILGALLFSAFLKGSLGLGFSTICLAILANVIDLKTAISIVLLPSLISNALVMIDAGNFRNSIRKFWLMFLLAVPGMILGLQLLKQTDNSISTAILALVLISYGCWALLNHSFRLSIEYTKKLNPIIGLTTGMVNGATGSQIFPIMPYLLSLPISKDMLVQTINLSFTLCSLVMLCGLLYLEQVTIDSLGLYSLGIIPVTIGVMFGNRVRNKLSDQRYRQAVFILMIVLGLLLLYGQF